MTAGRWLLEYQALNAPVDWTHWEESLLSPVSREKGAGATKPPQAARDIAY